MNNGIAQILSTQNKDDIPIFVDRLGNLQPNIEVTSRTEAILKRTKFGSISVQVRRSDDRSVFIETFNGADLDALRYVAGLILYGIK